MLYINRTKTKEIGFYAGKCISYIDSLTNHAAIAKIHNKSKQCLSQSIIDTLNKKLSLRFKKLFITKKKINTVVININNVKYVRVNNRNVEVLASQFYRSKGILEIELIDCELDNVKLNVIAYEISDLINRTIDLYIIEETEYLQ